MTNFSGLSRRALDNLYFCNFLQFYLHLNSTPRCRWHIGGSQSIELWTLHFFNSAGTELWTFHFLILLVPNSELFIFLIQLVPSSELYIFIIQLVTCSALFILYFSWYWALNFSSFNSAGTELWTFHLLT